MSFFSEILEWLKSWPVPVWSTIGGATMTLMGVFFSDWRNTKRLHMQNSFAASQAERTRIMNVRKEVYLTAGGVIARMQSSLVGFAMAESSSDLPELHNFADLVGKIAMVGESNTLMLAQRLAADFNKAHTTLTPLAAEVRVVSHDVKIHEAHRKKYVEQVERVEVDIAKFLESGNSDEAKFSALQRGMMRLQKQAQDHWAKENAALLQVSKKTNEYMANMLDLIEPLNDAGLNLLIALRTELGQQTNEVLLREELARARASARQQLADLIAGVDSALKQRESAEAESDNQE